MNITRKFSTKLVLTLALTSLLSSGLGLASYDSAIATSATKVIQLAQSSQNRLPRYIARAVLRDASRRSGVVISSLQITQVTQKTFGNSCEFNFGEICTKEYRPIQGWEVVVRVRNQSWTYHVNQSGSQIVLDPKINVGGNNSLPRAIANKIINDAVRRSGVTRREIEITQVTRKTFGNPCEFNFGEICTREFNPIQGWEVVVRVRNQSWTYHVNQSGSQIVLDPQVVNPGLITP
ncbi:hypothetical protein FD725_13295 [Nostoc sp. TCL26-01]|nr:hypothetical protein FD725_13295 [Nostoc sp. TCL26-01]